MAEAVLLASIEKDSEALFALGIPTKADYHLRKDGFGPETVFTLNQTHTRFIEKAKKQWTLSLTAQAKLLDDSACEKLRAWLKAKKETFETALTNKEVLHFDILVLGIVSTAITFYGLQ